MYSVRRIRSGRPEPPPKPLRSRIPIGKPGRALWVVPPLSVGHDAVVHLKTDDIYIDINFISWSSRIGGGFSYSRSTPAGSNVPPTVTIITPSDGSAFTAPASVTIEARADDSDGSVTNVEFFDGGASLGSDNASPFSVTANLVPGAHSLTAVATDNLGATTTSLSVTVTVSSVVITNPIAERIPKGDITIE